MFFVNAYMELEMRISMFLCAVLLASAVCSNLLATGVSIPTKLQGTAAGQRVVDIYKGLVGQDVSFVVERSGDAGKFVHYTGTIEAVVLADIHDFITSGDQDAVQLKLEMGSVQTEDPQADGSSLPKLIDAISIHSYLRHLNLNFAGLQEVDADTLGEKIRWVRLLALHGDREDLTTEVLVEMESDGDVLYTEIEPFIAKLPSSALPHEVFLKAFPDGFMDLSLEGTLFSTHFGVGE